MLATIAISAILGLVATALCYALSYAIVRAVYPDPFEQPFGDIANMPETPIHNGGHTP